VSPDAAIQVPRENTDKVVELYFGDGEVQTAKVILVDDEGVVYDLLASQPAKLRIVTAASGVLDNVR
jgi:hypothetical protein